MTTGEKRDEIVIEEGSSSSDDDILHTTPLSTSAENRTAENRIDTNTKNRPTSSGNSSLDESLVKTEPSSSDSDSENDDNDKHTSNTQTRKSKQRKLAVTSRHDDKKKKITKAGNGNDEDSEGSGSSEDSDSEGESSETDDESDVPDVEKEENETNSAEVGSGSGLGRVMAKILAKKAPESGKGLVMMARKVKKLDDKASATDENEISEIKKPILVKEEGSGLEEDEEEEKEEEDVKMVEEEEGEKKVPQWKVQMERDNLSRVKPDMGVDRETERNLLRITTRGVVQLFNAVKEQQRVIEKKVAGAGKSEWKRDRARGDVSLKGFMDILDKKHKKRSAPLSDDEDEKKPPEKWSVLTDDLIPGTDTLKKQGRFHYKEDDGDIPATKSKKMSKIKPKFVPQENNNDSDFSN